MLNRMESLEIWRTSWSPVQNRPHLHHKFLLKDVVFLSHSLLTHNLLDRPFEVEHTGSLFVSRNFVGSAMEDIELLQEAGVWTVGRKLSGCGMFRNWWSGRTRRLDGTL